MAPLYFLSWFNSNTRYYLIKNQIINSKYHSNLSGFHTLAVRFGAALTRP